jgi:hypothetical protein
MESYDYEKILLISTGVSVAIAIGLTIYGQSLLKPKNNQGVVMEPTSSQKTNAWLLMILPWFIPLVLYYVYSNNKLTPTERFFREGHSTDFLTEAGLRNKSTRL